MPLIIITGLPSSGKTHRAQQIHDYISHRLSQDGTNNKRTVSVVKSHHASQDTPYTSSDSSRLRDEVYTSSAREKTARAEEFSAVKRGVSRDNVVIADCPNYIKGYRYQLWCEAKAASTRCCVIHVAATEQESTRWNEERLRAFGREKEISEQGLQQDEDFTKHGKDVRGDLVPESHTAIYGDRLPDQPSRSRSSSMDGSDEPITRPQADDTMTLKSLYISSPTNGSDQRRPVPANGASSEPADTYLPSLDPPALMSSPPYSPTTLLSLSMRYEPPSPFSRWDTPLFTIPNSDAHPPYSAIFDAIFPPPSKPTSKKALSQLPAASHATTEATKSTTTPSDDATNIIKPHAATLLPTSTSASALQLLESSTLLTVRELLASARAASAADGDGGLVAFSVPISISTPTSENTNTTTAAAPPDAKNNDSVQVQLEINIPPGLTLTQPLLQRLRRKYTQLQRGRIAHGQGYAGQSGAGVEERRREVVVGFARFLEGEFGGGGGNN